MRVQITLDGEPLFDSAETDPPDTLYRTLAALWCGMSDDDQARFFEEVGKNAAKWNWDNQAWYIAKHMRTCECVTSAGRDALRAIVEHLDYAEETR